MPPDGCGTKWCCGRGSCWRASSSRTPTLCGGSRSPSFSGRTACRSRRTRSFSCIQIMRRLSGCCSRSGVARVRGPPRWTLPRSLGTRRPKQRLSWFAISWSRSSPVGLVFWPSTMSAASAAPFGFACAHWPPPKARIPRQSLAGQNRISAPPSAPTLGSWPLLQPLKAPFFPPCLARSVPTSPRASRSRSWAAGGTFSLIMRTRPPPSASPPPCMRCRWSSTSTQ
ncbi:hypothetical protein DFJ74DRAFT_650541 [Hyaloraphidium curvatum]|nr:hypothetical protein DFJ74DRAFT_650541 [Hyaloraphidium curvatum]